MVAREPLERDVPHIVMFLTCLLESPLECEIAHIVPRAGTLVPISESETKITYQVPGFSQHRRCVIARGCLRTAHGAVEPAPAFGGTPLRARRGPRGPSPVGWPHPGSEGASAAILARLRGVCGHGKAPAGAGAFGSAFEVFQDVCQVCGVVAAEVFEEVDFDVHWGFLSLFPLCCTSILSTATPRVKSWERVLRHISGHHKLPNGKTKVSSFQLRTRNLHIRKLLLRRGNLQHGNLHCSNLHLRSSNLRLRR